MRYYTEDEIARAQADYAERHGIDDVDVCRNCEGGDDGKVIGFRLSPGDGTGSAGIDERFGVW